MDEAAQATECECLLALNLASETTRVILAGDHMQVCVFTHFVPAFLPRDVMLSAVYATPVPSVCLSIRLSVTRVLCINTGERIIEILSRSDRPIILVFRHQGSLRESEGMGVPNTGGGEVAIFDQYAATSRKR